MRKRLQSWLTLSTLAIGVACAQPESDMEAFSRAIAYEYKTCQMTFLMTRQLAEGATGDVAVFWKAYHRLYANNRSLYEPLAPGFAVSNTPGAVTRFRGWISAVAGKLFPAITIRATQRLATKYVVKLRAMRDIGPAQHRPFLDYVVRMEELQVSFLADAVGGDYTAAAAKVDRFLALEGNRQTQ